MSQSGSQLRTPPQTPGKGASAKHTPGQHHATVSTVPESTAGSNVARSDNKHTEKTEYDGDRPPPTGTPSAYRPGSSAPPFSDIQPETPPRTPAAHGSNSPAPPFSDIQPETTPFTPSPGTIAHAYSLLQKKHAAQLNCMYKQQELEVQSLAGLILSHGESEGMVLYLHAAFEGKYGMVQVCRSTWNGDAGCLTEGIRVEMDHGE
ncbi:hypothetical protein LTR36_008722 [Oleoguttula mirabilis]|uniref:Uncharacterized protein n=1 Tax=Oleoguttula mirabilis TaxID=1507867 RepID=A0AAV9JTW7_9PEZI|nr:hypothetical protein LTR36_008722 [Oleoguttula mirabilis]